MYQAEELYRKPVKPLNAEPEQGSGNSWLPIVGGIAGVLAGRTAVGRLLQAVSRKEVPLAKAGKTFRATPDIAHPRGSAYADFEISGPNAFIHDVYVDREVRRKGLATDMMKQIESSFPFHRKWIAAESKEMNAVADKFQYEVARPKGRSSIPVPNEVNYSNTIVRKKEPLIKDAGTIPSDFVKTPKRLHEVLIKSALEKTPNPRSVIEPHGGGGEMAVSIRDALGMNVDTYEINKSRNAILQKIPGINVLGKNFLKADRTWDINIMNPPYSKAQWRHHVIKGYDHLNEGGTMVAVLPNRELLLDDSVSIKFAQWLTSVGAENITGASMPSKKGKRISVSILRIHKPYAT